MSTDVTEYPWEGQMRNKSEEEKAVVAPPTSDARQQPLANSAIEVEDSDHSDALPSAEGHAQPME